MYEIPTSIEIDGKQYNIRNKADYRVILDCFLALNDIELDDTERIITVLIVFYEDFNSIEDVCQLSSELCKKLMQEMMRFINCYMPENQRDEHNILVDWEKDSQIICAAINNVAHKEIRAEEYIHWWTFMGYYLSIGESVFSQVVAIRDKILKGKKLEKHEKSFKASNPQFFEWNHKSVQDRQDDKFIQDMWNS